MSKRDEEIRRLMRKEKQPVVRKSLLIALAVVLVTAVVYFYFALSLEQKTERQDLEIKKEEVAIVSEHDAAINQQIVNIADYDWTKLAEKQTGSNNEKLAALLLLYTEEDIVIRHFYYMSGIEPITEKDVESLKLLPVGEETNKENINSLIENLIMLENFYYKEGLDSAQTHISRLRLLQQYFSKYKLSESVKIPDEADIVTNGRIAENQRELMAFLLSWFIGWNSNLYS